MIPPDDLSVGARRKPGRWGVYLLPNRPGQSIRVVGHRRRGRIAKAYFDRRAKPFRSPAEAWAYVALVLDELPRGYRPDVLPLDPRPSHPER